MKGNERFVKSDYDENKGVLTFKIDVYKAKESLVKWDGADYPKLKNLTAKKLARIYTEFVIAKIQDNEDHYISSMYGE